MQKAHSHGELHGTRQSLHSRPASRESFYQLASRPFANGLATSSGLPEFSCCFKTTTLELQENLGSMRWIAFLVDCNQDLVDCLLFRIFRIPMITPVAREASRMRPSSRPGSRGCRLLIWAKKVAKRVWTSVEPTSEINL